MFIAVCEMLNCDCQKICENQVNVLGGRMLAWSDTNQILDSFSGNFWQREPQFFLIRMP